MSRFAKGDRVIVQGRDGVPDQIGTVQSHVATSVFVQYDVPLRWQRSGEWWWEGSVRPLETAPTTPVALEKAEGGGRKDEPKPVMTHLFDF